MRHNSTRLLLLVTCSVFLLVVVHALQPPKQAGDNVAKSCIPRERDALLAFKQGITNDTQNMLASWRPGHNCCRWTGVTCSNKSGHVIKLDLHDSNGDIFWYGDQGLVGQISPSLLSLEHLEYLDLSQNHHLVGLNYSIPEFLGLMKNLRHLDLSFMYFSGRLPSFLGNLSNLEYLDISFTSFSGGLPPQLGNLSNLHHLDLCFMQNLYSTDITWLSRLHLLEYLDMSFVNLSATLDWPHVLNTVPSLQNLDLSNCSLSSANQSIVHLNLTNLYQLDLSSNNFDHSVSSCWFWNLTSIKKLDLSGTYLYGEFPIALGRMINLQRLYFSSKGYHNTATMQVDLKDLCELEYLTLVGISLSSGDITEFLEKLPRCPSNKLLGLRLRYNNMTGLIPDRLMHLTSLVDLDLSNNHLTGAIPPGIGNRTGLYSLDLSNNHLTGAIPPGIGNRTSLQVLDLSNNHLTGAIPPGIHLTVTKLQSIGCLCYLDLSNNNLTGVIPPGIGNLTGLQSLDLSHNHLIGSIQPVIENNFHSLFQLDLSNNNLSGVVPSGIRNFTILERIILHSNQLTGQIPTLPRSLVTLDISTNNLSCVIPVGIGNFTTLETLILHSNQLTGQIPRLPRSLITLDISTNLLSGPLPP